MKYEHMNEKNLVEGKHGNRREESWYILEEIKKSKDCLQKGEGQAEEREKIESEDLDIMHSPMAQTRLHISVTRKVLKMQIHRFHLKSTKPDEADSTGLVTCT